MQQKIHQPPPIIGITMGDPVGIGPEIILRALKRKTVYQICRPLIFGDHRILKHVNALFALDCNLNVLEDIEKGLFQHGTVDILNLSDLAPEQIQWGCPTADTGNAMLSFIEHAIQYSLKGRIQGVVTGPINKTAMKLAGSPFNGHTELLAERSDTKHFRMMMAGEKLRVVLVTIHIPLKEVPASISMEKIFKTITITHEALQTRFGIPKPRIAVAGLNPHAGEKGLFGNEEKELISPAIETAQRQQMNIEGPYPPDTVFNSALKGHFDAIVCMYHDQGLIPFKMIHFEDGVNTTLGLPFIRTSVDHGTAYDIAGSGVADPGSLISAIMMASFQAQSVVS